MVLLMPSGRRLCRDDARPYGPSEEKHNTKTYQSIRVAHRHGFIVRACLDYPLMAEDCA